MMLVSSMSISYEDGCNILTEDVDIFQTESSIL